MPQLHLPDATIHPSDRDHARGWYRLSGRPVEPGDSVWLEGVRRQVAAVAELPGGACGVRLIPDFDDPGCAGCGVLRDPPTPEYCRVMCEPGTRR